MSPVIPVVPPSPPGPSLSALIGGLGTSATLVRESSASLCAAVVAEGAALPLRPCENLDTTGVAALTAPDQDSLTVKPGDYLLNIGEAAGGVMLMPWPILRSAAQWAIARYLWTFDPPGPTAPPYLQQTVYTPAIRSRQRGIWTEDMAIGLAQTLLWESLQAGDWSTPLLDSDLWLEPLVGGGHVTLTKPKSRPDYIALRRINNQLELLFVECKGTTADRAGTTDSMSKGVAQLDNITGCWIPIRRWVVAAGLDRSTQDWAALSVEVDESQAPAITLTPPPPGDWDDLDAVERLADRVEVAQILLAIGQDQRAAELLREATAGRSEDRPPRQTEEHVIDQRSYVGHRVVLDTPEGRVGVYMGFERNRAYGLPEASLQRRRELRAEGRRVADLDPLGPQVFSSPFGTALEVTLDRRPTLG